MQMNTYGEAYRTGYKKTTFYLTTLGTDPNTAAELSQAAWAKGWERLSQLREDSSILQWVNAIARRELATCFRRARLVDPAELRPEAAVAPPLNLSTIDMMRGLQKCQPHQRLLLEAFLAGYTNRELATLAGKSLGAIHAELYRARKALKGNLQAQRRQVLPAARVSRKKAQRAPAGESKASLAIGPVNTEAIRRAS